MLMNRGKDAIPCDGHTDHLQRIGIESGFSFKESPCPGFSGISAIVQNLAQQGCEGSQVVIGFRSKNGGDEPAIAMSHRQRKR